GSSGYDILTGGTGNDLLYGGDWEKDRYVFQSGHGQDIIQDWAYEDDYYSAFRNEVVFEGANSTTTSFIRSGNDLIIKAYGADDSVTLVDYLNRDNGAGRGFKLIFDDQPITLHDIAGMSFSQDGTA
ncbi:hypothetical protein, partial [Acinetobacter tianfuensis]